MRALRITLLAFVACAAAAPPAHAHAFLSVADGELRYSAPDAVSVNNTTIAAPDASTVKLSDPSVSGGIDPGSCVPITEYEVDCPSAGIARIHAELGPHNDKLTVGLPLPAFVDGGPDTDTIHGGPLGDVIDGADGFDDLYGEAGDDTLSGRTGEDRLYGGDGADVLVGGEENDLLDGGPGNDDIRARDGVPEVIACGDGSDAVQADVADVAGPDCESVDRGMPGTGPPPEETAPVVTVSGSRRQRVGRSRRVSVGASADKRARLTAYVDVRVFQRQYRLPAVVRDAEASRRVTLRARLTGRVWRQVRSALRGRQRVTAVVRVVARDSFGNRATGRTLNVRLLR
jgi:hypothetical protein